MEQVLEFENIDKLSYLDKWTKKNTKVVNLIQQNFLNSLKPVPNENIATSPNDLFLNFTNPKHPQLIINVKNRLEQHPELKQAILKQDADHLNILNIFIDTVSTPRFYRRFPLVAKFLASQKYSKGKTSSVYEFRKFHSLYGHTFPNLLASTYGLEKIPYRGKNRTRIEHYAFN